MQIERMQDQIMNLEEELDHAKEQLASGVNTQKNGPGGPGGISQIKGPTEREAINQQLELERERMRQQFNKGLEYANNDAGLDDIMKSGDGTELGFFTRCNNFFTRIWREYGPLSSTVTQIQKRYD